MYSIHNEVKFIVAKRFIRILKNKIYKNMTLSKKCVSQVVNKYNNKYYSTIKTKPVDVNKTHILILMKNIIRNALNLRWSSLKNIAI